MKNILIKYQAFSLIEMLVTIAIIAILTTIAYPIYRQYVQKTYRQQAKLMLFQLANRLEEYHYAHHAYRQASFNKLGINPQVNQAYQLNIDKLGQNYFLISTTPTKPNTSCGKLTLNNQGVTNTRKKDCW